MHVHASTWVAGTAGATGTPAPTRAPAKGTGAERSFRTALAEETAAAKQGTAPAGAQPSAAAAAATATAPAPGRKGPKGEKTEAVEGHRYAEIVAGPRNGMYLNTSGNKRDGQAFTLVERGGFHYHVYGTGRERQVFRVPDRDADATPAAGAADAAPKTARRSAA